MSKSTEGSTWVKLWELARDVQLRWLEERVVEYREWLKDPFKWKYVVTEEESIDAFIAWLKDAEAE